MFSRGPPRPRLEAREAEPDSLDKIGDKATGSAANIVPKADEGRQTGTSGPSTNSDRLSRLAQQKKRLMEQRARLMNGRTNSGASSQPGATSISSALEVTAETFGDPAQSNSGADSAISREKGHQTLTQEKPPPNLASTAPMGEIISSPQPANKAHQSASRAETARSAPPKTVTGQGAVEESEQKQLTQGTSSSSALEPESARIQESFAQAQKPPASLETGLNMPVNQDSSLDPLASQAGSSQTVAVSGSTGPTDGMPAILDAVSPLGQHTPRIPFGLAEAGGSGMDFFDDGEICSTDPASRDQAPEVQEDTKGQGNDQLGMSSKQAGETATIPFGRSASQASLPWSKTVFGRDEEEEDSLAFFDENGHVNGLGSQTNYHRPASERTNSTDQVSADWSRRTLWGSSSSLSTIYPPQSAAGQGGHDENSVSKDRDIAQPRSSYHVQSNEIGAPIANGNTGSTFHSSNTYQNGWQGSAHHAAGLHNSANNLAEHVTPPWVEPADDSSSFFAHSPTGAPVPQHSTDPRSAAGPLPEMMVSTQPDDRLSTGAVGLDGVQANGRAHAYPSWEEAPPAQTSHVSPFTALSSQPPNWSHVQESPVQEPGKQAWTEEAAQWQLSEAQNGQLQGWSDGHPSTSAPSCAAPHTNSYVESHQDQAQTSFYQNQPEAVTAGFWGRNTPAEPQWQDGNEQQPWGQPLQQEYTPGYGAHATRGDGANCAWSQEFQHESGQTNAWAGYQSQGWGAAPSQARPPRSVEEALTSPHGRPAVPLLGFGFGGRIIAMLPQPSPGFGSSRGSSLSNSSLKVFHMDNLAAQIQEAYHYTQSQEPRQPDAVYRLLKSIPGVLNTGTPKDRVLKFINELEKSTANGQVVTEGASAEQLLWRTLSLLVQHDGQLRPGSPLDNAPKPRTSQKAPASNWAEELSKMLVPALQPVAEEATSLEDNSSWSEDRVLSHAEASTSGSEIAAQNVQKLLQLGKHEEAVKVALDGHLWGLALYVSRMCGEKAFQDAATAMAMKALRPSTPLHTLVSISSPASSPEGLSEEGKPLENWRGSLAILANSQPPGREAALLNLGQRLWKGNHDVMAAHLCFILGGQPAAPFDSSSRLCLPGIDHLSQERRLANTQGILRGILLEWARQRGSGSSPQAAAVMLPYRLVLASQMADYGLIEAASQQAAAVTSTLNSFGGKMPKGLLLARIQANDLQLRLQTHAQAFRISIAQGAGGSLMSKAGNWIDRRLSKLIGVAEPPEGMTDAAKPPPVPNHRRSSTQTDLPKAALQRRVSSALDIGHAGLPRPHSAVDGSVPSATSSAASSPSRPRAAPASDGAASTERAPAASVRGFLGRVSSLTSLIAPPPALKREVQDPLGSENKLFYDDELKIWREKGKPPPEIAAPVGPPPICPVPTAGVIDLSAGQSATLPVVEASPASNGGAVQSRYVNTLGHQRLGSAQSLQAPWGPAAIAMAPSLMPTPSSGARPSFFVPATRSASVQNPPLAPNWASNAHARTQSHSASPSRPQ